MLEKKVKQSIQIAALTLLIFGYYLTPSSAVDYKRKDAENKIDPFPHNIDDKIQQKEMLFTGFSFNDIEKFIFNNKFFDNDLQNVAPPQDLLIFK
jgi:hypothetical protein